MLIKLSEHLKKNKLLSGKFRGTVVSNADPDKLRRVKVNIPGLLEGTSDTLPWCFPQKSVFMGGSTDFGIFTVPKNGTELVIEFPFDDPYSPFYVGVWENANTHMSEFDDDYPNCYGFKDDSGNLFKINNTQGTFSFKHFSGTEILIEQDGTLRLKSITQALLEGPKVAMGNSGVEVIDQQITALEQLSELCNNLSKETHIGNLAQPTTAPLNAPAYLAIKAVIDSVVVQLKTLQGSI